MPLIYITGILACYVHINIGFLTLPPSKYAFVLQYSPLRQTHCFFRTLSVHIMGKYRGNIRTLSVYKIGFLTIPLSKNTHFPMEITHVLPCLTYVYFIAVNPPSLVRTTN